MHEDDDLEDEEDVDEYGQNLTEILAQEFAA